MDGVQSRDQEAVKLGEHNNNNHNQQRMRKSGRCSMVDVVLRAAALGLTVAAAVIMGTAKQTTTVPVQISPNLPLVNVPVTAKYHYLSALVFFVVANAIACGYAGISILLMLLNKSGALGLLITVSDIIMVALLFSSGGAATAVGMLGHEGNSHVKWNKVCNVFGGFCDRVAASIALSLLGALVFVVLVSVAAVRLRKSIT